MKEELASIELMTCYLFVTDEQRRPEDVHSEEETWWSCSKTTRAGDFAFVYVKGTGITYLWRVTSQAEPNADFRYQCDVEYVRTFEPPITLQEIQSKIDKETWAPPHQNFWGFTSIKVPLEAVYGILDLRK